MAPQDLIQGFGGWRLAPPGLAQSNLSAQLVAAQGLATEPWAGILLRDEDRVNWFPLRRITASDAVTATERVQSLIPVLEWQTGYSYYNNYSSRKPGDTGPVDPGTPVDPFKLAGDDLRLAERWEAERIRLLTASDSAGLTDTGLRPSGRYGKAASDTVSASVSVFERHGLWSFAREDGASFTDRSLTLNGRQVKFGAGETVGLQERTPPFKFDHRDSVAFADTGVQSGRRVFSVGDSPYLYEAWTLSGRRGQLAGDTVYAYEYNARISGTKAATRADAVTFTERGDQTGRRAFLQTDTVTAEDTGTQRGGLRQQRAGDTFTLAETAVPFLRRVDDRVGLEEQGTQSGTRAWTRSDAVQSADTLTWFTPLARETARLSETWRLKFDEATRRDSAALSETHSRAQTPLFGVTETLALSEAGTQSGLRAWTRADTVGLNTSRTLDAVRSVVRSDTLTLNASGEQRGRRSWTRSDLSSALETTVISRTKTTLRGDEAGLSETWTRRGQWALSARETFTLAETPRNLWLGAGDTVTLTEGAALHRLDWRETFTLTETPALHIMQWRENVALHESHLRTARRELPVYADSVTQTETRAQHGLRAYQDSETFSVTQTHLWQAARQHVLGLDAAGLTDTGRLHTRNVLGQDAAILTATGTQSGTRAWTRRETVAGGETGLPGARHKTALRTEDVTLTETTRRNGRVLLLARDTLTLQDAARNRWPGEADTFTLTTSGRTEIMQWRDTAQLRDKGFRDIALRQPLAEDTFRETSRAVIGTLLAELEGADTARLAETGTRLRGGVIERLRLSERAWINGLVQRTRADSAGLQEAWTQGTDRPRAGDTFTLGDTSGPLGGRLRWTARDGFVADDAGERHGRWALAAFDAAQLGEPVLNPALPVMRETVGFSDAGLGLVLREDYALMRETQYLEDRLTTVQLRERGWQSVRVKNAGDSAALTDAAWINSPLELRDRVTLQDARHLTRDQRAGDGAAFTERGRLFRRSDYLEPDPDRYDERPGRRRTALRLVRDLEGRTWAVWLGQGQVHYAMRPHADSWQGHVITSLPLPFEGARSVTLIFRDQCLPVVEAGGFVRTYIGGTWTQAPGVDPLTVDGELLYLSPDRRTLHAPSGQWPLPTRARAVQGFDGGALLLSDLGERLLPELLGALPPRSPEPDDEIASVRWPADRPFTRADIPIEGKVSFE